MIGYPQQVFQVQYHFFFSTLTNPPPRRSVLKLSVVSIPIQYRLVFWISFIPPSRMIEPMPIKDKPVALGPNNKEYYDP